MSKKKEERIETQNNHKQGEMVSRKVRKLSYQTEMANPWPGKGHIVSWGNSPDRPMASLGGDLTDDGASVGLLVVTMREGPPTSQDDEQNIDQGIINLDPNP